MARADENPGIEKRLHEVRVHLFSQIPGQGIESYRNYGGGTGRGNNVTLGTFANDERRFRAEVKLHMKSHVYLATVKITPDESDSKTKSLEKDIDLSELRPQTVEIGQNEDGRVYRLNIIPSVAEYAKPVRFDVLDMRLDQWSFSGSEVVLNDSDFLGFIGMSSGTLAYVDLAGVAKIEFSLLPFRNAQPIGVLQDGTIRISHPGGDSLRISKVHNGRHGDTLAGGPYEVFVRWNEPSQDVEEYRSTLAKQIETIRTRIARGELPANSSILARLEKALGSDRLLMMSYGLGPIPRSDQIVRE